MEPPYFSNEHKGEKILKIEQKVGLFSPKEKIIIHFNSGKRILITPEDPIGLRVFINIEEYNYSNCIEVMTVGKNGSDIHLFPNSNFHRFFNTEEISGLFLMNNMIIRDITYSKQNITVSKKGVDKNDLFRMLEENKIDQYLKQLEEKTIIDRITVHGEVDFNSGYNYITYPESLPNFSGKSKASFSITSRPDLDYNSSMFSIMARQRLGYYSSMSYGLVVKWI